MAKFPDCVKGLKYRCDKCKEVFDGEKIKLEAAATNIAIFTPGFHILVVDEYNEIQGVRTPSPGDRSLHCPNCGELHTQGFDHA